MHILAKYDQTAKPKHVIQYYIKNVKSTGHLNLHERETPEGGWKLELNCLFFYIFK